jgi:hypothetical protein
LSEFETVDEQVEEAIKGESPPRRRERCVYSDTARRFFSKIKALRGRGYSFVQICKAYEKAGQLPKRSNPYSFRQAFLRESGKRNREEELLKELKNDTNAAGKAPGVSADAGRIFEKPEAKKARESAGTVQHRIREMTGTPVDTGLGRITRHSDGSFEY